MKRSSRRHLLATTIITGLVAGWSVTAASAQEAPQDAELDEVVVTGSRIPQTNLVTSSPVTQVTGEDIDVAGVTRVEDLISQLPQAFAAQNSTVANGASGTATVSLRNLGSSRTLVLSVQRQPVSARRSHGRGSRVCPASVFHSARAAESRVLYVSRLPGWRTCVKFASAAAVA